MKITKLLVLALILTVHLPQQSFASSEQWQKIADYFATAKQLPKNLHVESLVTDKSGEEELTSIFPFDQHDKHNILFESDRICETINNTLGCRFSFSIKTKGKTVNGFAWLDKRFGLPLQVEWTVDSVPFKEDDATIHSMQQTDSYKVTENGQCFPENTTTNMELEYSILFFSKQLNITSKEHYSDYVHRTDLPKKTMQ